MQAKHKCFISACTGLCCIVVVHLVFLASIGHDCGHDSAKLLRLDASRRHILMLGDSISQGMLRHLPVPPDARVVHPCLNMTGGCANSARAVRCASQWVGNRSWDTIVFNFGMHDVGHTEEHTGLSSYVVNMRKVIALLRHHTADLVWVTTTPIPNQHRLPRRTQCDVLRYNDAVQKLVSNQNITTVDMFSFVRNACDTGLFFDSCPAMQIVGDIHFTPQGYQQMAQFLASRVSLQQASSPV